MVVSKFFQDGPVLGNPYTSDHFLRSCLRRLLGPDGAGEVDSELTRFGQRVSTDVMAMGEDAERNEPQLVQYDPWGRRVDRIVVSRGWNDLRRVSAEEGLVAIGYERRMGAKSRVHQLAKLYLFHPSSAVYSCPLAMTDGAARLIELLGDDDLRSGAFRRLTSRDPGTFWTSGQWMTERPGGSDLAESETIARREGETWRLYGDKWFTSAVDADMAMTLARIVDDTGEVQGGSRGLSLFALELRRSDGRLAGIEIKRLKDKLGTRALPTAELTLDGVEARLVGAPGAGVRNIANLFNVTRIYNAVCAAGFMRRGLDLARDYARRRRAFGRVLSDQPLHIETLAWLEIESAAALLLVLRVAELMGKVECGTATRDETATLRLLTPLAKLYTAKQAVAVVSEVVESFGGAGYVEDLPISGLLRDTQVLSIWEGTTNVLALDALRAITKEGAFAPLMADSRTMLDGAASSLREMAGEILRAREALQRIESYAGRAPTNGPEFIQAGARAFAYSLARTYMAALAINHAAWARTVEGDGIWLEFARRWCAQDLTPLISPGEEWRLASRAVALGLVPEVAGRR